LWPYIGGIAREHGMKAISVGGWREHGHVALSMPATVTIAKVVQVLKGNSSKWIAETFPSAPWFGWQEGYAAASVGYPQLGAVLHYISNQEAHHAAKPFEDELREFLRHYGVEWQEEYLLG
jgi:REP element-mobilizing transposase RayT